jgi:hypothetical protein
VNPPRWDRLFCTVAPVIMQPKRFHLGWVTANWNPTNVRIPQGFCWEGLSTLPYSMGRVIQFLYARIRGRSRLFALLDKQDGADKGLAEITLDEGHNILADGTQVPIEWQMMTKRLQGAGDFSTSGWSNLWLYVDHVTTPVHIDIYARSNVNMDFTLIQQADITPDCARGALPGPCSGDGESVIPLGNALTDFTKAQWLQIWVVGTGVCSPNLAAQVDVQDSPQPLAENEPQLAQTPPACQFDPFGYAKPAGKSGIA